MSILGGAGALSRPQPWRPYATYALLLGLVAWQFYVGGGGQPDAATLMQYGARKATYGFPQAPWRLLSSIFVHAGWWHLLSNLVVLGVWGACFEKLLGRWAVLSLFVLSGLWGNLISDIYGPSMVALGASGGAFAMVAAVWVLAALGKAWPEWEGEAKRWLVISSLALALNIVGAVGLGSWLQGARLDHWAHAGGALCGGIIALLAAVAGHQRRKLGLWGATLFLGGAALFVMLSRGTSPFA